MTIETIKCTDSTQHPTSVGILSDTHGLLRPEVITSFKGVDFILHAGDVGDPEVIDGLESIAPVVVVRGNMDYGSWADQLPVSRSLCIAKTDLFLIHDLEWIEPQFELKRYQVIVTGHTHRPLIEKKSDVLFFNPGSAGHQRRGHALSVGKLILNNGQLDTQLIELGV
jgi:putative phosphoesterase